MKEPRPADVYLPDVCNSLIFCLWHLSVTGISVVCPWTNAVLIIKRFEADESGFLNKKLDSFLMKRELFIFSMSPIVFK